jgi:hypothetical protein
VRAALAVLAVAVLAGCGGGGVSEQSYAKKANTICKRYRKKANALSLPEPTKPAMRRLIARIVALVREENTKLRKLAAPESERAEIRKMLAARDDLVDVLEQHADEIAAATIATSTTRGRAAAARLRALLDPPQRRAAQATKKLGLAACAAEFRV